MLVRAAHKKDAKAIRALVSAYPKQLAQDHVPAFRDFFVAEEKGEVVGCVALEIYSKKIAEVRSLVVKKGHQRKGIATKLVRACLAKAKKKQVREVLTITGIVELFDKLGFKAFHQEKYALFKMMK